MPSPREYYQSAHPEYFSDSELQDVEDLDRSVLDFTLSSLTKRSQEMDFERFARRLCEKEVCPNLLPTTGPTGGGDSKADSETFPVADSLALKWYGGVAREASQERWAFAFSAKAEWLSKVKSDVKKIAETARGYTKVFFVTNQSIPARKRSSVEDTLSEAHRMDVRILDRTWILERVFGGQHEEIAIEELRVQTLKKRTTRSGPVDTARAAELAEIESRVADAVGAGQFGPKLVDDALDAALLCRSLERPRTEVEGAYARADRIALKYGSLRQQVESAYQWAWTLFWWYEDFPATVDQYEQVEGRAKDSSNIFDLERLSNLLTCLNWHVSSSGNATQVKWYEERTTVLRTELERLSGDGERPSVSLQAHVLLLQNDLLRHGMEGTDPSTAFDELKQVVERSEGLVGFPMKVLVQVVSAVGERIEESPAYDSLFDAVVNAEARRSSEVRAARLLLKRGEQLIEQGRAVRAIALTGQALGRLYKHETRSEIVHALYLCAHAYERIGLFWAARGTYLSGASIAANEFWTYGTVSRQFAACVRRLKWTELRLARLPHLLVWHEMDTALRSALSDSGQYEPDETDFGFDLLLARMIVRARPEQHVELRRLVPALDRLGLTMGADIALFLIGHADRLAEAAQQFNETPEQFAAKVGNMQAGASLPDRINLRDENSGALTTKILGCSVIVNCTPEPPCVEIGESFLASLESFLSTISARRAAAFEPELTVDVISTKGLEEYVAVEEQERLGRPHFILRCRHLDPNEIPREAQESLREQVFEAALKVSAHIAQFRDPERDLLTLFKEERVAERAAAFTGAIGSLRNVLGNAPRCRISHWLAPEEDSYEFTRRAPWIPETDPVAGSPEGNEEPIQEFGNGEPPPDLFDPDTMSHQDMTVVSPIRQRLWDRAGWGGVFYGTIEGVGAPPPLMGLIFKDKESARQIFTAWRSEFGEVDEKESLRLTIIRGIDKANPFAYRLLIRGNHEAVEGDNRYWTIVCRVHRMDATTPINLDRFLKSYSAHKRFLLVPAHFQADQPVPMVELGIGKFQINVRDAWQIGRHDPDSPGVAHDDDVIVPDQVENPPVRELQRWRQSRNIV
jgi:hypothetical protein